jgi:DNA-binding NtrC family response regulator
MLTRFVRSAHFLNSPQKPTKAMKNPIKILLIDDDCDVRATLSAQLIHRMACEISEAASAEEGLELINGSSTAFDVVLTDVTMPGMDGFEFIRILRENGLEIPVLLMSGDIDLSDDDADHTSERSYCNFIPKPWKVEMISEKLHECVSNQEPMPAIEGRH